MRLINETLAFHLHHPHRIGIGWRTKMRRPLALHETCLPSNEANCFLACGFRNLQSDALMHLYRCLCIPAQTINYPLLCHHTKAAILSAESL